MQFEDAVEVQPAKNGSSNGNSGHVIPMILGECSVYVHVSNTAL